MNNRVVQLIPTLGNLAPMLSTADVVLQLLPLAVLVAVAAFTYWVL